MIQRLIHLEALKPFAAKYVWWKTVDEAVTQPQQIMAQVMSMGDYDDVQRLVAEVGDAVLTEVLMRAQPGQFDERSWPMARPARPVRHRSRAFAADAAVCVSSAFKPRMDVLPPAQRALWPQLGPLADLGFVLYGGTAVALRLGHRSSVDFDFFSNT